MRTLTNESDGAERRVIAKAVMAAILFADMRWRPELRYDLSTKDMAESCASDADVLWEAVAKQDDLT